MGENAQVKTSPWPMSVESVLLRDAGSNDIEALLAFRNLPEVNRFMIRTSVEPDIFRQEWLAIPESAADFSCVAELDNMVVGIGFLEVVDGTGQPGMPSASEALIGYIVNPNYWERGVGSALASGLLKAAFDHLQLRRVTASCNADNLASVRILEGLKMRREHHGIADSWHAELGWVDSYRYAMLKREWDKSVLEPSVDEEHF